MNEVKKNCDTCLFSYYKKDTSQHPTIGVLRQHCSSEGYNSPSYTEEMFMEDLKKGYCRFWAANEERGRNAELCKKHCANEGHRL